MSDDVKKIFSNFQIDKKNQKSHIDHLSKIKPDYNQMNVYNPVIKQNNTLMKTVNLRKQKSHNQANIQQIEENEQQQPKLNFILSGTQRTDKKLATFNNENVERFHNPSKNSFKDISQSSFINDAKLDVTGSKQDLVSDTIIKTNHTGKSSKPTLIQKNDQNKQSSQKIKEIDENTDQVKIMENKEQMNYEKNIQSIINQRKMVDMQINNTSTAVEEKLIQKQKNNKNQISSFSSETLPKTDYKNLDNQQNENDENKTEIKTFDFKENKESPSKTFNKTQQKEDIRKKIDYDISETLNVPTRNNEYNEWLQLNPLKVERFDNNKQATITNFYKSRDQDNALKASKYLGDQMNDANRTKVNFESQTKEIKMSLFNNLNPEDKLNNMRDPITKELKPKADLKNTVSRFRDTSATGSNWFKNKAKPNRQGQFSEKFKSVSEICKNNPNY